MDNGVQMIKNERIDKCSRCNNKLIGKYCSSCGLSRKIPRIERQYILNEIRSSLNFDKGILFTFREILLRPGITVKKFIKQDRSKLVKPINFVIASSIVSAFTKIYFEYEEPASDNSNTFQYLEFIQLPYGFNIILTSLVLGFWIHLFFKHQSYNYFEILVFLFYILGVGSIINTFFVIFECVTLLNISRFSSIAIFLYILWAIDKFLYKKKALNYLKGFLSMLYSGATIKYVPLVFAKVLQFMGY